VTTNTHTIQVEHVILRSSKSFADVRQNSNTRFRLSTRKSHP
jgi:hypothetical protein